MHDEHFRANGQDLQYTLADYCRWFARNERIGTLKASVMEYCVGKLLNGLESAYGALYRTDNDMRLTEDGIHVGIRWTGWKACTNASVRNAVSFAARFSAWPDVVLFGLQDTSDKWHPILDLDAWSFYSVKGTVLKIACSGADRVSLTSILKLGPVWSDYNGIPEALQKALSA